VPNRASDDPVLRGLLRQAFLFEDPTAYEAGVLDAYAALCEAASTSEVRTAV